MNKSNFALISALYDTKGADLYNDVYFPIIKYEIVNQYYTQSNIEKYYNLEELQGFIDKDFGIKIPLIVLKQAVRAIGNGVNGIELSVYENGKQFRIKKAWDISINVSIDDKSQIISTKFVQLEHIFQRYLEVEGLSCDKTFLDFYSDHTEEIFKYIEEAVDVPIINQEYVNLAHFLSWLNENEPELYHIANDIFWGSIIAGFLKRSAADINIKPIDRVDYYLDSALVLAILDLDNSDNVAYGQELLDIIKASGNTPKVHSLTIREISSILTSVENSQGPKPNSAIEGAYYRRELTPSKILSIKNNLVTLVEGKGIIIHSESIRSLDEIEIEYKNKKTVKDLREYRGYGNDNIRDIHDIYLRDFILQKRGKAVSIEKINSYFVSLNSDLISYFKDLNPLQKPPIVIHPSKIIIDLWMHNSSCSFVKKNGLTEAMSRCFALNKTDIRRKVRLVSRYYKESDSQYNAENYKALYSALLSRSTQVLRETDAISLNEENKSVNSEDANKQHVQNMIKFAVEEELRKQQKTINLKIELEQLSDTVKKANQSLISSNEKQNEDSELISNLQKEVERQKRINVITEKIAGISGEISQLEILKNKSISKIKFILIFSLECISIIGLVLSGIFLLYSYNQKVLENMRVKSIVVFCISLIIFLTKVQNLYILSPKIQYQKHIDEQINYWIKNNPEYSELKSELKQNLDHRKGI